MTNIVQANNKLEKQDTFVKSKQFSIYFMSGMLLNEWFCFSFKEFRQPAYPGYQPEVNLPEGNRYINTYETDTRVNYLDPRLKKFPIDLDKMLREQLKK